MYSNNPRFVEYKPVVLNELAQFCAETGLWGSDFLWKMCSSDSATFDSMNWWNGKCKKIELKKTAFWGYLHRQQRRKGHLAVTAFCTRQKGTD